MERTWKPTAAGVLSIIGGGINAIWGIAFALLGGFAGGLFGMGWLGAIGTPAIILGIIAIVGGVFALRRRIWGLALVGSICALIGPAGLLGILAIIFVIMGKREFE
jgi:hypothetical protein